MVAALVDAAAADGLRVRYRRDLENRSDLPVLDAALVRSSLGNEGPTVYDPLVSRIDGQIRGSAVVTPLLHDVGKIAVPDRISRKPGRLTPDEYAIVRRHPEIGVTLIDAYSAMTVDRPYHKGMTQTEAVAELRRCARTQFDPQLVESFIAMVEGGDSR